MRIVVIVMSLLNGTYMLTDGIYVIINGKYIGPDKPGPWANIFYSLNINVFKLGPLFISFGIAWLFFIIAWLCNMNWAFVFGTILSVLTLWYLPVGTLFSLIILILLILLQRKIS